MKRHKRWLWILIVLTLILVILALSWLFGMTSMNMDITANGIGQGHGTGGTAGPLTVGLAGKFMTAGIVLALFFGFMTAMLLFPPLAVTLAIFFVIRHKKVSWKVLRLPILLALGSVIAWNINTLFVNGSGYYFNHDFGSNVYNEGYIIPHYEELYQEELTMIEKNVIDDDKTVFTLRSGKTGEIFTVQSENYSTGSGAFDRLHLTSNYSKILGLRLKSGERIALPFDEYFHATFDEGRGKTFRVRIRDGKTEVIFGSETEEIQAWPAGKHFFVSLEEEIIKIEVPLLENEVSVHCFEIAEEKYDASIG